MIWIDQKTGRSWKAITSVASAAGRAAREALRSHPFLLLGIATLVFAPLASSDPALLPWVRLVIAPAWLGWTVAAIVANSIGDLPTGPSSTYQLFSLAMLIVGGLLPYAVADGLLWSVRRSLRAAQSHGPIA